MRELVAINAKQLIDLVNKYGSGSEIVFDEDDMGGIIIWMIINNEHYKLLVYRCELVELK